MYIIVALVFVAVLAAFIVKDIVVRRKQGGRYHLRETVAAYGMMTPALLLALIFVLLPIVFSLGYAFTNYYLLRPNDIQFNGFENFKRMFQNIAEKGDVLKALKNTGQFVIFVVPLQILLALALALIVNRKMRGMAIFKIMFFAPQVISLTVTSYLWLRILDPSDVGLINAFLIKMGLGTHEFLKNPNTSMYWIILISAWQGAGYQMLIFLSGLQNVRKELYEAASLDGASKWRQFWCVTMPGLRSTLLFVIITVFIGACKVMVQPMLMTGKTDYTITMNYLMYIQGYSYRWVGYSSAIALMMTIVIGIITCIQRFALREKD